MKTFRLMTEGEYNLIKNALDNGASQKVVRQMTNRSSSTVTAINTSSNYDEYRTKLRESRARYNSKHEEKPLRVQEELNTTYTTDNEMIIQLKLINSNLARLATAWEEKPKKFW